MTDSAGPEPASAGDYSGLPGIHVTADQIVAANLRYYRQQAGLKQGDLGQLLGGLTKADVSAMEVSRTPGRPVRRFNAETVVRIAMALGVPLAALFLPPEDDGITVRYLIHPEGADCVSMPEYVPFLDSGPYDDEESPAARAYTRRWAAVTDPQSAGTLAAAWREASGMGRAGLLERLAGRRAALAEMIRDLDAVTDVLAEAGDD